MFAPVMQEVSGKVFIVASQEYLFPNWLLAMVASDEILARYNWSGVAWAGYVVDVGQLKSHMEKFLYRTVPVMVINYG